nr:T6SS effector BTH_I2691 family protein [Caldimonas brevitalea]
MANLLPERRPSESRFALRLLRRGYVYVYIASPPPGVKNWLVYRVTDQADLLPEGHSLFVPRKADATCSTAGHNTTGMKLLSLPRAHLLSDLWMAYSGNLWSDALKARNAANPNAMQYVSLDGCSPNTFKPTVDKLKGTVLECALTSGGFGGPQEHDFPFNSVASEVDRLVQNLQRAAECHPKTKGKELAVVLRDPVGVAAELNALRMRRQDLAKQELLKPEIAHPLNSSNTLLGLEKLVGDVRAVNNLAPLVTKGTYESLKRQGGPRIQQATWEPIASTPGCPPASSSLGRLWYPGRKEKLAEQSAAFGKIAWKQVRDEFNETSRSDWMKKFDADMKTAHYQPLERFELDWLAAARDGRTQMYFALHFDDSDPNDPKQLHSPGLRYAEESGLIHQPQPLTTGAALKEYLALYDQPIVDPKAVPLRALMGNQGEVVATVHKELLGDPNAEVEGGMRDKTVDLIKGLLSDVAGEHFKTRYSWLTNALCGLALGSVNSYSAAVSAAVSTAGLGAVKPVVKAGSKAWATRVWELAAWSRGLNHALQASLGSTLKIPVLLFQHVSLEKAAQLLGHPNRVGVGGGTVLALLTDTEEIRAAGGDLDTLFKNAPQGQLSTGVDATQRIGHLKNGTVLASGDALKKAYAEKGALFDRLYAEQSARTRALPGSFRQTIGAAGGSMLSIDARLALAGVIVQVIGLMHGLAAVETAQKAVVKAAAGADRAKAEDTLNMARLGLYDSMAGLIGGLMDTARIGGEAMSLSRQAAGKGVALPRNIPINALRFGIQVVGVFGGALNAYVSAVKAGEARAEGNYVKQMLYLGAAGAFFGTLGTSSALAAGVAAEFIIARQIGAAGMQAVAERVAVRVGTGVVAEAAAAAGAVTFAGTVATVGVVLLGIGLLCQVGAAVIEPSALEKWASKTYFGKGREKYPQPDWTAEHNGLLEALGMAAKPKEAQAEAAQQCAA